ncbi:MAG: hypothetical protein QM675_11610 [Protaetiibacter sp.]
MRPPSGGPPVVRERGGVDPEQVGTKLVTGGGSPNTAIAGASEPFYC